MKTLEYEERLTRSLNLVELKKVTNLLGAAENNLPGVDGGTLEIGDENGNVLAEVWYDVESEQWQVIFWPGLGR